MNLLPSIPNNIFPDRPRSIYERQGVPFYIYAPDYRNSSGGIRVLHYFCHLLNELGEEAYVVNTRVTSPCLRTPKLTFEQLKEHFVTGRNPVTIYPEVLSNNPLNTPLIARWLLNVPGHLGKPVEFETKDIICYYESWCIPNHMNGDFLHIDPLNYSTFNNNDNPCDDTRDLECYYANKYYRHGNPIREEHLSLISLGQEIRRTPKEIADILRRAKVLYCYEPSGIINEAQACGCPVLLIRSDYWELPPEDPHHNLPGCAVYGEKDALASAQRSLPLIKANHDQLRDESWTTTQHFVDTVYQALADLHIHGKPLLNEAQELWALSEQERNSNLDRFEKIYLASGLYFKDAKTFSEKPADQELYKTFLKRISLQEIDGQLLAERMVQQWQQRPLFNVIIEVRDDEQTLLADTIDSIAAQWYKDWHLTIVAPFHPEDDVITSHPQITWVARGAEESIKESVDWAVDHTPGNWLIFLEPGNTLESHSLAFFADSINYNDATRLLYCDEDIRNTEGEPGTPRFKPDINLELLRNMYYLGGMLVIERQTFLLCGGWSAHQGAEYYDLSLRVIDQAGLSAITHQRDLLLHTPEKCLRSINNEAEQKVVQEHVDRNRIAARIETGFLEGTQKVTYLPQGSPLISIIIPTRDQPGYLSHCVESIAKQTLYPNWELILVDHATQDRDALEYLESLLETPPFVQSVDLIRTDGEFNYARLCNLGASIANGKYLLFLDNDTEIIQPTWLDHLIGYLQQPQVAAVAPRLSKPDGTFAQMLSSPRVLGLGGLASGIISEPMSLIAPGYCGRLQVAQDTSALAGSCFAISTEYFQDTGGFNEKDTPVYECILEMCLRLRENKLRLIWTPWVDVVHHDGVSRKRLENDPLVRGQLSQQQLNERDYFYTSHLNQLKDDPFYHRHLSLNGACSVEPNAVIDWDTRFHDRLRVLGLPLTSGSGEYRMTSPFRVLQYKGLAQTNIVHPIAHKVQRVLTPIELARYAPDTLMLQQAIDDVQINQLKRYRKFSPEVFVTYAVDDVLGSLPRKHYLYNFQAREGKSRMREGLAHCNRLIVSTVPIAEYCKDMISDIVVIPNRLERSIWCHHTPLRKTSHKPRVGWAGAQQHLGDLELIKDVVESLADEVDWIFMGMCPSFLKPFVKEEHTFVSYVDYPAKLASLNLDLAIAPLENHLFNEGKSNLRLLEYGIMGWPVICTDIYPYQTNHAPVKRVENTANKWIAAIRERINDLDATYREGDTLKKWVLQNYILEDHVEDWLSAVTPSTSA